MKQRGPAIMARWKCENTCDIVTLDLLCDIPVTDFYSFRDPKNNKVYGYDILSLCKILEKYRYNPYTRVPYSARFYTLLVTTVHALLPKHSKHANFTKSRNLTHRTRSENIQMTLVNNPPLLEDVVNQIFERVDTVIVGGQRLWFDDLNHSELVALYMTLQTYWRRLSIGVRRSLVPIGYRRVFIKSYMTITSMPDINLRCRLAVDIRRLLSSNNIEELVMAVRIFLEALSLNSSGCREFFTNHRLIM